MKRASYVLCLLAVAGCSSSVSEVTTFVADSGLSGPQSDEFKHDEAIGLKVICSIQSNTPYTIQVVSVESGEVVISDANKGEDQALSSVSRRIADKDTLPAGKYRADVIVDGTTLKSCSFTVRGKPE
jgi:hypothetical protein